MQAEFADLPNDVDALKAALLAKTSSNLALIAHLKLQIKKLNRNRFGPRSERTASPAVSSPHV